MKLLPETLGVCARPMRRRQARPAAQWPGVPSGRCCGLDRKPPAHPSFRAGARVPGDTPRPFSSTSFSDLPPPRPQHGLPCRVRCEHRSQYRQATKWGFSLLSKAPNGLHALGDAVGHSGCEVCFPEAQSPQQVCAKPTSSPTRGPVGALAPPTVLTVPGSDGQHRSGSRRKEVTRMTHTHGPATEQVREGSWCPRAQGFQWTCRRRAAPCLCP